MAEVTLQGVVLKEGEFAVVTVEDVQELLQISDLFNAGAGRMQKLVDRLQARLENEEAC